MTVYLLALFVAMAVTALATPAVIRLAHATNILDRPGLRKAHRGSVPRLGGVAVLLGTIVALVGLAAAGSSITWSMRDNWPQWIALALGAMTVFVAGVIDDIRNVRAVHKLLVQVAAASAAYAFGIRIEAISLDSQTTVHLGLLGWPITILWIAGITNAVNLIDGLDGLAAGIAAIAALVIACLAFTGNQPALALVMVALAGSLGGFLLFNFHPARIFLGDCGAMAIGFLLAGASVRSVATTGRAIDLALPALALVLPILDTLHCIFRRRVERRSVFSSDRGHIHHRLMDLGLSHRGVCIVLYGVTVLACGFGLLMLISQGVGTIIVFLCVVLFVVQLLKAIGAMPLRENVIAMHRSRAIAHRATQDRQAFERSRLRFESIASFDQWWAALCASAGEMRLSRICISADDAGASPSRREWRAHDLNDEQTLRTTLLLRLAAGGLPAVFEIDAPVDGVFESASCRVQYFARLIDEYPPTSVTTCDQASLSMSEPSHQRGDRLSGDLPADDAPMDDEQLVLSGFAGTD